MVTAEEEAAESQLTCFTLVLHLHNDTIHTCSIRKEMFLPEDLELNATSRSMPIFSTISIILSLGSVGICS